MFKREVLGRYVPLFASFVADDPPPPPRPPAPAYREWLFAPLWGDEFDGAPLRIDIIRRIPEIALLLTPLWILWQARRAGRKHNAREGAPPTPASFKLPPELRYPAFPFGLKLELRLETAHVLDTQVWSETSVSWQSRAGGAGQAPSVSVQTHVTQKERLWVETMDAPGSVDHQWRNVRGDAWGRWSRGFSTCVAAVPLCRYSSTITPRTATMSSSGGRLCTDTPCFPRAH